MSEDLLELLLELLLLLLLLLSERPLCSVDLTEVLFVASLVEELRVEVEGFRSEELLLLRLEELRPELVRSDELLLLLLSDELLPEDLSLDERSDPGRVSVIPKSDLLLLLDTSLRLVR